MTLIQYDQFQYIMASFPIVQNVQGVTHNCSQSYTQVYSVLKLKLFTLT